MSWKNTKKNPEYTDLYNSLKGTHSEKCEKLLAMGEYVIDEYGFKYPIVHKEPREKQQQPLFEELY